MGEQFDNHPGSETTGSLLVDSSESIGLSDAVTGAGLIGTAYFARQTWAARNEYKKATELENRSAKLDPETVARNAEIHGKEPVDDRIASRVKAAETRITRNGILAIAFAAGTTFYTKYFNPND